MVTPRARSARRTRTAPSRVAVLCALALLAPPFLSGCRSGRDFRNENDRLRRLVLELQTKIDATAAERDELNVKLAEAARAGAFEGVEATDPEVAAAIPRIAGVRIGRLSGPVDLDGVPGPDALEIYIEPYDGRRRFVQATGRLTLEITFLQPVGQPEGPETRESAAVEPHLVIRLDPGQVRDAFRSDLLGFRYTVRVPLPEPNQLSEDRILVRAVLEDAITGQSHEAERLLRPLAASQPSERSGQSPPSARR